MAIDGKDIVEPEKHLFCYRMTRGKRGVIDRYSVLTDMGLGGDAMRRRWREVPGQQGFDFCKRRCLGQFGEDAGEIGIRFLTGSLGCFDHAIEVCRGFGAGWGV